jgi:hypothetical protein
VVDIFRGLLVETFGTGSSRPKREAKNREGKVAGGPAWFSVVAQQILFLHFIAGKEQI